MLAVPPRYSVFALACAAVVCADDACAAVTISTDPTQNMVCSSGTCTPTSSTAVLNITDLTNMLATSNVQVIAYFRARHHDKSAPIELETPLSWSSKNTLTLNTGNWADTVLVDAPITTMGGGGLIIVTNLTLATGVSVTFWDLTSTFSEGSRTYTLVGDLPTLAADIAANPSGAYALARDHDAIGDVFTKAPVPQLNGTFDGLGHTVSNLTVRHGHKYCEGLFSSTGTSSSLIRNVSLHSLTVKPDSKSRSVGGLVGCSHGYIVNVTVDGSVTGPANASVGGIVGSNFAGQVQNSHSNAKVSGGQVGGVVGENYATIYGTSAVGTVTGNVNSGGVAGLNKGSVSVSFATGPVTGNNNTGGLVGSNHGGISDSYAFGAVTGGAGPAGGLVGFSAGAIASSYSTGAVSGEQGYTGGLVGYDPLEQVSTAYWDLETSGISDPQQGAGFPTNDPGITGLTTAQLQSKLPYGLTKPTWHIDANVNGGLPYLRGNPPQ